MSFRERPEYQEWRDQVFALFGRACVLCGHDGNIHAHHVKPVNTYPELAFNPRNGVPLCGNCHVGIKDDEMAYVARFTEIQERLLGVVSSTAPSLTDLSRQANDDPTNTTIIEKYFLVSENAKEVVEFFDMHRGRFKMTVALYVALAGHLRAVGRHEISLRALDAAWKLAEHEKNRDQWVLTIAHSRVRSLSEIGRRDEAVKYLNDLVFGAYPQSADLHYLLACILRVSDNSANKERARQHLDAALQINPNHFEALSLSAHIASVVEGRHADALRFGKRLLTLAATNEQRIEALHCIASAYEGAELYEDAICIYKQILDLDGDNVDAMAYTAHSLFMIDRERDAYRMAKKNPHARPRSQDLPAYRRALRISGPRKLNQITSCAED